MLELFVGIAILVATAVAFRMSLPVGGRVRPWITPKIEPYVCIALLGALTAGVALTSLGSVDVFDWR
jgi:hypothetical protein